MPTWPYRQQLSLHDRVCRSIYEILRDQLDIYLVKHALIDSYENFSRAGEPYQFVTKRELKPRARMACKESALHNSFLVLFCEGNIPRYYKKYIRFFDTNKVTKEAVSNIANIPISKKYTKNLRYFDNLGFEQLVLDLSAVDYSLLIQKDPSIKSKNRYALTHFHVKIDWPIDDAAEEMAQQLRYISKELYENGEKYAQDLNRKLFESYGFHYTVGGRRSAAVVAAQFLKKMDFISTVYVMSSESRALTRISERGINKCVLIRLPYEEIIRLSSENRMGFETFVKRFLVEFQDNFGVGILNVAYQNTIHAKPPEGGKLRRLKPEYQWLTVSNQLLIPLQDNPEVYPIPYNTIYMPD